MTRKQIYLTIIFGIILSLGLYDYLSHFKANRELILSLENSSISTPKDTFYINKKKKLLENPNNNDITIDKLTHEDFVINYIKKYHTLPEYYITKSEARKQGWLPEKGNLCDVLPNKAIGGDIFGNREKKLPKGKIYYEADVNYTCGNRNTDRIIFTPDGEVWLTKDHYKTFVKQ